MKTYFPAISLLLFLFLSAGCARPPVPVEQPRPVPFDTASLQQRADFWRDYQAKFRLRVDSKTAKFNVRAIVLIEGSHFARFETFGPIGQTAALYVSNETGPSLLVPSEKVVFTAGQPETLIRHFLGVTLPFEVFRYALAASIPPEQLGSLDFRSEGGVIHVISKTGARYFDWQFLPEGPSLSGVYISSEGFEGRISYEPAVPLSKETTPKKIRISSSEWNMEVSLEELKPSPQFQPAAFYMPNLPDIKKVNLDAIK